MIIRFLGKEFEISGEDTIDPLKLDITTWYSPEKAYKLIPNEFIWTAFKQDIEHIGLYNGASFEIDGKKALISKIVDLNQHVTKIHFKTILED